MIAPIVELAQKDRAGFREVDNQKLFLGWYNQIEMPFDFESAGPRVLDWSYSNMCKMWDLGYAAGVKLCDTHWDNLCMTRPKAAARRRAS